MIFFYNVSQRLQISQHLLLNLQGHPMQLKDRTSLLCGPTRLLVQLALHGSSLLVAMELSSPLGADLAQVS